jgi:hypothetical protein
MGSMRKSQLSKHKQARLQAEGWRAWPGTAGFRLKALESLRDAMKCGMTAKSAVRNTPAVACRRTGVRRLRPLSS